MKTLKSEINEGHFRIGDLVQTKQYYLINFSTGSNGIGIVTNWYTESIGTFDHEGMKTTLRDVDYVEVLWAGSDTNISERIPAHMLALVHRD